MAPAKSSARTRLARQSAASLSQRWQARSLPRPAPAAPTSTGPSCGPSLPFFDAQDVGGAAIGGEQIGAVLACRASRRTASTRAQQPCQIVVVPTASTAASTSCRAPSRAQLHAQPFGDEGQQVIDGQRRWQPCRQRIEQFPSWQAQPVLQNDADDAERRAAQRVTDRPSRSASRRWRRIRPACRSCRRARRRWRPDAAGTASAGPFGCVMVADRLGDGGVLAVMQRVIAAHDALQFREIRRPCR